MEHDGILLLNKVKRKLRIFLVRFDLPYLIYLLEWVIPAGVLHVAVHRRNAGVLCVQGIILGPSFVGKHRSLSWGDQHPGR